MVEQTHAMIARYCTRATGCGSPYACGRIGMCLNGREPVEPPPDNTATAALAEIERLKRERDEAHNAALEEAAQRARVFVRSLVGALPTGLGDEIANEVEREIRALKRPSAGK